MTKPELLDFEPPAASSFEDLMKFADEMRQSIEDRIKRLPVRLEELSENDGKELLQSILNAMQFELDCLDLEVGMPISINGTGLFVVHKDGADLGSELINPESALVGSVGSTTARSFPTMAAKVHAETGVGEQPSLDFSLNFCFILKDAVFYTGIGGASEQFEAHSLEGVDVHVPYAKDFPLRFASIV